MPKTRARGARPLTIVPGRNEVFIVAAASLLSAVLGSVHAFSVFIDPLEAQFSAARSAVSLTYSGALVSLTLAVLLGPRVYARWPAAWFLAAASALAMILVSLVTTPPSQATLDKFFPKSR